MTTASLFHSLHSCASSLILNVLVASGEVIEEHVQEETMFKKEKKMPKP
jgi:hypothetical protein